jgi:hypothetical protein
MEDVGIFGAILSIMAKWYAFCMAIWYILRPFGKFSPVLVFCAGKNLATLLV